MFQLLNRFAWFISVCVGLLVTSLGDWIWFDLGISNLLSTILSTFLVKQIFFSNNYINSRLQFFQASLSTGLGNSSEKTSLQYDLKGIKKDIIPERDLTQNSEQNENYDSSYISEQLKGTKTPEIVEQVPREQGIFAKFFSENLLAKLGAILVFLGVLFLLSLVYTLIGPVAKMILGFAIGFSILGAGIVLDKRGYKKESRILMGTAFLINYLVILSGRYLLGTSDDFLSVGITFVFLILNTVLAGVTALVYDSKTLLLFSFIVAYINPLLLGSTSSEPYTLLGYTMIVTLGALFISYREKNELLFSFAFGFASLFFLSAPWSDGAQWITKLTCINILGALSLYVSGVFEKKYQYISETLIGGTFFLIGLVGLLGVTTISPLQLSILSVSSLGLMIFCYMSTSRGAYLYSIGTLGAVLTLSPALLYSGIQETHIIVSACSVAVFLVLNVGIILKMDREILSNNIGNILGGLVSGATFLTYIIYVFGNTYFPGIAQGFVYIFLAIIYSGLGFCFVLRIGVQEISTQEKYKNVLYAIFALGISIFSLAIAFVLSEYKEIISLVWLLEASVLFFLSQKTKSLKVAIAGLVLFIVGVIRILPFMPTYTYNSSYIQDYGFAFALLLVLLSLMLNLFFLFSRRNQALKNYLLSKFYIIHNFFHAVGISALLLIIGSVIDPKNNWYFLLYFAFATVALGFIYRLFLSLFLAYFSLFLYALVLVTHISFFINILGRGNDYLLLSTITTLILTIPHIYSYIKKESFSGNLQAMFFEFYLFLLSTLYIYHIFSITFAVTLYWGVLAFFLLSYGIKRDIVSLRTLGLYLIVLTAGKVFFYDIWMSVDNVISRVVALIVVGILMIILSTMYTKKYGNNLNREFNPENLFGGSKTQKQTLQNEVKEIKLESGIEDINSKVLNVEKEQIRDSLLRVDSGNAIGVRMYIVGQEKPIQIRTTNIVKIAKIIEKSTGKMSFLPGELANIYADFSKNYESTLSKDQYKKIQNIIELFVKNGGKIEFVTQ